MTADARTQLAFLDNLQRILNQGSFVATYKYALIRVIADLSVERRTEDDGCLRIPLSDLAERFIEVYWRQVAPFRGKEVLLQSSGRQAAIVQAIAEVRQAAGRISVAKGSAAWNSLVRRTERLLVEMPLFRLQRVGDVLLECFYENRLVDRAVCLKPGVAACFRAQSPIVQALVQLAWLRFVQQLPHNHELVGRSGDLAEFLFGADRGGLRSLVDVLHDLQGAACFYCRKPLRAASHVDHFVPWARYQRDLGHNFVLTHDSCNSAKADRLAAVPHLDRWVSRNLETGDALRDLFTNARILYDGPTSLEVASWSYDSLERSGGFVWKEKADLVKLGPEWRSCFGST